MHFNMNEFQVYEDTSGLTVGDQVIRSGKVRRKPAGLAAAANAGDQTGCILLAKTAGCCTAQWSHG